MRKYNRLLVKCGLIRIEERHDDETGSQKSHMYYVLDPPPLPVELQERYDTIKLIESDFLEAKALAEQALNNLQDLQTDITQAPLQSLQGGVQSLKDPPATIEEAPLQPLNPKKNNKKEKNRKNNNTTSADVVVADNIRDDLYSSLCDLAVHHRTAQSLLDNYEHERIKQVLNFATSRLEEGWQPRQSPAAWIVAALRDEYELAATGEQTARETEQEAQIATDLQRVVEQQREQQSEEYQAQRQEKLHELGVSPETDQLWQRVQERLKQGDAWSPALHLAFLARVSEDKAVIITQYPIVRQRLSQKDRLRAIRRTLYDLTGAWMSVEVESI